VGDSLSGTGMTAASTAALSAAAERVCECHKGQKFGLKRFLMIAFHAS